MTKPKFMVGKLLVVSELTHRQPVIQIYLRFYTD